MILRFCGSTDAYCLPCHGCQSGCSSESSCPAASPTPAPSLTTRQKTGIIIGTILFAVLVLLLLWYKERTKRELLKRGPWIHPSAFSFYVKRGAPTISCHIACVSHIYHLRHLSLLARAIARCGPPDRVADEMRMENATSAKPYC